MVTHLCDEVGLQRASEESLASALEELVKLVDHYLKNAGVLVPLIETILPRAEVDAIVQKYDPKALLPSHDFFEGLTTSVPGLESADGWANDQEKIRHADVRRLNTADLTLNAAERKSSHHRVYYCGSHFEKK